MKRLTVGVAEMQIAEAPDTLISYGLGSCIGIAIFDSQAKIGGMAHAMLSSRVNGTERGNPLKYVDSSIEIIVAGLLEAGCVKGALLAKMAGGAHMFRLGNPEGGANIGERNAMAAREKLEALGIPLVAEDVGGSYGRTLELDPNDGTLVVRSLRMGTKQL